MIVEIQKRRAIAALISSLQHPLYSLVDGCVKFRETFGEEDSLLEMVDFDFSRNEDSEVIDDTETSFIDFDLTHNLMKFR